MQSPIDIGDQLVIKDLPIDYFLKVSYLFFRKIAFIKIHFQRNQNFQRL